MSSMNRSLGRVYERAVAVSILGVAMLFASCEQTEVTTHTTPDRSDLLLMLPIAESGFGWLFASDAPFSDADMTIQVVRGAATNSISVVQGGQLGSDWFCMPSGGGEESVHGKCGNAIASKRTIDIRSGDVVEVHFTSKADLNGITPFLTAYLPAGKYRARLLMAGNERRLDKWDTSWPIVVTRTVGWDEPEHAHTTLTSMATDSKLASLASPERYQMRRYYYAPEWERMITSRAMELGCPAGASLQDGWRFLNQLHKERELTIVTISNTEHWLVLRGAVRDLDRLGRMINDKGEPLLVLWGDRTNKHRVGHQEATP